MVERQHIQNLEDSQQARIAAESISEKSERTTPAAVSSSLQLLGMWGSGRNTDALWIEDGRKLLVSSTQGVALYDAESMAYEALLNDRFVERLALVSNGQLLFSSDSSIAACDYPSGQIHELISHEHPPLSVAFAPVLPLIAIDTGEAISVYDLAASKLLTVLPLYSAGTQGSMAFSYDGRLIAVVAAGVVRIWSIADRTELLLLDNSIALVSNLLFAPDGASLFIASETAVVRWQFDTKKVVPIAETQQLIRRIALSHDGEKLAVATSASLQLWDLNHPTSSIDLSNQPNQVLNLVFSPSGNQLLAVSQSELLIWSLSAARPIQALYNRWAQIRSVAFAPSGEAFATLDDEKVTYISIETQKPLWSTSLPHQHKHARGLVFSPSGEKLAVTSGNEIYILAAADGALHQSLSGRLAQNNALAFAANGEKIVAVTNDGIYAWAIGDGTIVSNGSSLIVDAYDVALSADGETCAIVEDDYVTLWNLTDPVNRRQIPCPPAVNGVALTNCGDTLAIASDEGVQIWACNRATLHAELPGGAQQICFSANGRLLVAVERQRISVWRVVDMILTSATDGHRDIITGIAVTPTGNLVISVSRDGTLCLWGCSSDRKPTAETAG